MQVIEISHMLDDIFVWGDVHKDTRDEMLDEIRECVEVYCQDNNIDMVDIDKTLATAKVVVSLEFVER